MLEFFRRLLRSPVQLEDTVRTRTAELATANAALRREIDERRQVEERLRLALESGRMGAWDWDIATGRVVWSPGLEAIHGIPPGSFPGTFEAYQRDIHPADGTRVIRTIWEAVETRRPYRIEYRLVWPDGSVHWVEARGKPLLNEAGKAVRATGVCMDITERKRSDEAMQFLADASRSLAALVDQESTMQKVARLAVPRYADWCAVHIVGGDGGPRQVAVAHLDAAKAQLVEELGRQPGPDADLLLGAARVVRTGHAELVEDIPTDFFAEAVRKNERLQPLRDLGLRSYMCVPLVARNRVLGALTFVCAESGRRYGAADLAVAEDLGHRAGVAIENARLYAEQRDAARRKDDFVAMLAHELRNPLTPVRSGLDLLSLDDGQGEVVALMREQIDHLVRLVDDLLDVSRIVRGKIALRKETVALATVVQRATETAQPLLTVQEQALTVALPPRPLWVDADPVRLAQIITNLLNNAAKYTDPGGHVWLTVAEEGGRAVITVRDDGMGIEPDLLAHVFELFTQGDRSLDRAQGGLGIGLTVVRGLVEQHGGTIEARSAGLGKGSAFIVRLPLARGPLASANEATPSVPAAARRVLVVEDNAATARLLTLLLSKTGQHHVHAVHDGNEALGAARDFAPAIVLLDIGLPGMNGFDVARRLRDEFGETLFIVALTGYGQEDDRRRSREAGFDEHLLKPPSLEQLQALFVHPKLQAVGANRA